MCIWMGTTAQQGCVSSVLCAGIAQLQWSKCDRTLACAETASQTEAFEIPEVFIGDAFIEPFSLPPERRRSSRMLQRSGRLREDSGPHIGMRLVRPHPWSSNQLPPCMPLHPS